MQQQCQTYLAISGRNAENILLKGYLNKNPISTEDFSEGDLRPEIVRQLRLAFLTF